MYKNAQFFYPDNQTACKNMHEFVEYYSEGYDNQFGRCKLEKRIENLLISDKKLKRADVEDILCWKTGQACINLCEIDLDKARKIAMSEKRGTQEKPFFNAEEQKRYSEILKRLKDVKGIGIVYAISILYFMSNGKYPIYDRFAQTAITALKKGLKLGESVPYSQINASAERAFAGTYNQYCKDIEHIFQEDYTRREVDKALWIYGHLFNKEDDSWEKYLQKIKLL